jgi:RNA polymerase primary sigma factor
MKTASRKPLRAPAATDGPRFVFHPSFEEPNAEQVYGALPAAGSESTAFMPDDTTRDCTRRMHYAAWRAATAATDREAARWRQCYYDYRDRIVVGNRKLTFRAVRKWGPPPQFAEDLTGECQIVLIQAVAAFNPWLSTRFSTYAFTCLLRALSRLSQRQASDRLSRCLPLESLPGGGPSHVWPETGQPQVDEYFQPDHTLLTPREKTILIRRYLNEGREETLEEVGHELGLSKERVRQIQSAALGKLRAALLAGTPRS